jgi:hypothetical protein
VERRVGSDGDPEEAVESTYRQRVARRYGSFHYWRIGAPLERAAFPFGAEIGYTACTMDCKHRCQKCERPLQEQSSIGCVAYYLVTACILWLEFLTVKLLNAGILKW